MEKVIILGGGNDQIYFIDILKKKGFYTILIDYYENPPARNYADIHYQESTLDEQKVIEIARKENVIGVFSACIDQALLTAAKVNEELGLFFPLSYKSALNNTNKVYMKSLFFKNKISTSKYIEIDDFTIDSYSVDNLEFPLIVKPSDSNGSYGITKVEFKDNLRSSIDVAMNISRSNKVIVEEFIEGIELSVDAFVEDENVKLLMITENIKGDFSKDTFPISRSVFPAPISSIVYEKIKIIIEDIARVFKLKNIPLLVQLLVKNDNVYVIEFGSRIGGGSKHFFINEVTGVNILEVFTDTLLKKEAKVNPLIEENYSVINYIYTKGGVFKNISGLQEMLEKEIINQYFPYKTFGVEVDKGKASRDRIGAFFVKAKSLQELNKKMNMIDMHLKVLNENNEDIMFHNIYKNLGDEYSNYWQW